MRRSSRWWRRALWVTVATTGLGGLAFGVTGAWVREARLHAAERKTDDIAGALRNGLNAPVESLHAVRAFLQVPRTAGLTLREFQAFCRPALERYPELVALEWFPRVTEQERARFERWVAGEQPGFEIREPTRAGPMVRAVARPDHIPLTFAEPYPRVVEGLDLGFDPARVVPVERALNSGESTLSYRFQLVEDPPDVFSVAAYEPVTSAHWIAADAQLEGRFERGVAVALFRINPLIERALRHYDTSDVAIELREPTAPPDAQLLYHAGDPVPDAIRNDAEISFFDKSYRLSVFSEKPTLGAVPFLMFGATVVSCLALIAYADARRRARRLQRAAQRLGQYQIEGRIASGGMGTVYRARHALMRRPTAIKIAHEEQSVATFEKEVLLTSALTHPNTVMVYDFGRGEDGTFYYAMEYIDGYDLEQLVQAHGPLPPGRVLRILLQTAGSLQEAHGRGLVHRDVKPSNIMLTERGGMRDFVKVLDFGLAKPQALSKATGPTASAVFAGTPGYVAPEVIAGSQATSLSDIFSLGAVAYFLLAGRGPFAQAVSSTEALTLALTTSPVPLPGQVPSALADLVMACLSRQPEQRPRSMQAVTERLRAISASCPWTQQDAEAWWTTHPRPGKAAPSAMLTFLPKRSSGSNAGSSGSSSSGSGSSSSSSGGPDARGLDARGLDARGLDARGLDARGLDARGLDASDLDASGPRSTGPNVGGPSGKNPR